MCATLLQAPQITGWRTLTVQRSRLVVGTEVQDVRQRSEQAADSHNQDKARGQGRQQTQKNKTSQKSDRQQFLIIRNKPEVRAGSNQELARRQYIRINRKMQARYRKDAGWLTSGSAASL